VSLRRFRLRTGWKAAVLLVVALVASGCAGWTTYHHNVGRTGADLSAPGIVPAVRAWTSAPLDGLVYAEPLVYAGRVYVATENDSVYALELGSGTVIWRTHLGTPVPRSSLPCGNIDPLGITGTPVIDPVTNLIFVVTEAGPPIQHALIGLDATNGRPRVLASGDPFPVIPATHQQRAALTVANGRVYWAYGGLLGDCGTYHGTVLSVRTDGSAPAEYVVPTHNRGAIWGSSGPAVDPAGNVWVATGNGDSETTFDHGDSVIKLSPTLHELGFFAPSNWAQLNRDDADLGSTGPLILPDGLVFQVGKSGDAYLVRQSAPGGIGGQVTSLPIGCGAYGGNAFWAPGAVYVPCLSGTRALALRPGPRLSALWTGPSDANGSPVFGGNTVWTVAVDTGRLYALNPLSGAVMQAIPIGHARHFTTPTIAGDTLIVATDTTIQAFRHR
jgi:outer membrane protein assembly factor BamB